MYTVENAKNLINPNSFVEVTRTDVQHRCSVAYHLI